MPVFTFRAQPALDLRRREHEAAQRVLARADAERQQARARLDAAERAAAQGRHDADTAARSALGQGEREWYRFWIIRLDRERGAAAVHLQRHDEALAHARSACLQARQRCEALERLREKAYAAYLEGVTAAEKKIIDELATQRYALRADKVLQSQAGAGALRRRSGSPEPEQKAP
jgi:flagellar export protein FliJ